MPGGAGRGGGWRSGRKKGRSEKGRSEKASWAETDARQVDFCVEAKGAREHRSAAPHAPVAPSPPRPKLAALAAALARCGRIRQIEAQTGKRIDDLLPPRRQGVLSKRRKKLEKQAEEKRLRAERKWVSESERAGLRVYLPSDATVRRRLVRWMTERERARFAANISDAIRHKPGFGSARRV